MYEGVFTYVISYAFLSYVKSGLKTLGDAYLHVRLVCIIIIHIIRGTACPNITRDHVHVQHLIYMYKRIYLSNITYISVCILHICTGDIYLYDTIYIYYRIYVPYNVLFNI